jgi:hypothetical protein
MLNTSLTGLGNTLTELTADIDSTDVTTLIFILSTYKLLADVPLENKNLIDAVPFPS